MASSGFRRVCRFLTDSLANRRCAARRTTETSASALGEPSAVRSMMATRLCDAQQPASAATRAAALVSLKLAAAFVITSDLTRASNGEVEGPRRSARQAPRAHTFFRRPRRQTDHASRPPRTIVRRPVRESLHIQALAPHRDGAVREKPDVPGVAHKSASNV